MTISIIHDEQGIVAAISILVDNIYCPLPWNPQSKSFDWDSVEYVPTKDKLISAWEQWKADKDLQFELRDIQPVVSTPTLENWEGWNVFMSNDVAYNRLTDKATNQRAVTRLEMLFVRRFFQSEMIVYWEQVINSVPLSDRPSLEEVEVWRNAVNSYNMPFSFTDAGFMEVV